MPAVYSATLTASSALVLTIRAGTEADMPGSVLPGNGAREHDDRIRAAVISQGLRWPTGQITVTTGAGSLREPGPGADLAVAVAILAAGWSVPADPAATMMFYARLSPDGTLLPAEGVRAAVAAASGTRCRAVVVAAADAAEASSIVRRIPVISAGDLAAVVRWLRDQQAPQPASPADPAAPPEIASLDISPAARMALQASAAGGHHLSLLAPPGPAAPLLARAVAHLMPPLGHYEALEVARLHPPAPAGRSWMVTTPPFISPERALSLPELLAPTASVTRPGAAVLAHQGVLFLDQAPEFSRMVLDGLRQPIDTGEVVICRCGITARFPARLILVISAARCPCRAQGIPPESCECTVARRRAYLRRLPGPLTSRIPIKISLPESGDRQPGKPTESMAVLARRVRQARDRASSRLAATPWRLNCEIPRRELTGRFPPEPGALALVSQATRHGLITQRAAASVLRVAWTLADLAGRPRPDRSDCQLALRFQTGDIS